MITIYSTIEEFDSLEPAWNELYARTPGATPFQSFAFCRAALPLLSGSLHIIAWRRKNELLAIFPLYIDSSWTLRFINDRHADFCGPLVAEVAAGDFHLCEALAEHIRGCKTIRRVRLENLRRDLFQTSLQFQLKGSLLYGYSRYSYFTVPAAGTAKSFIDSLAQLSTKEKYRLKNIFSKIEKSGAAWRSFDASRGDAWPAGMILSLTDSMVSSGIRKRKYLSPDYLAFVQGVYDSGAMMISATYLDGKPVSCNLYLKNGDEFIDWMAFYTEPSYNAWNLLQFLEWFHSNGGGTLNFARGIYMYKVHNFRPALGDLGRFRYSKCFFGRVGDAAGCLISEIKRMRRSR